MNNKDIVFLSLLSLANFFENEDNILLSKKVNLGLDLQGGSYLLLEVDSQPIIKQKLQDKVIFIRKALKKQKIKYKNLKLQKKTISFHLSKDDTVRFDDFFLNKENSINVYFNRYRSYEMDFSTTVFRSISSFSTLLCVSIISQSSVPSPMSKFMDIVLFLILLDLIFLAIFFIA